MLVDEVAHSCYLNSFREVKREPLTSRIWLDEVREAMGGPAAAVGSGEEGFMFASGIRWKTFSHAGVD